MNRKPLRVRTVSVNAIEHGNRIILVDRHGRSLGGRKYLADIEGALNSKSIQSWQWKIATQRMKGRLSSRCDNQDQTPWQRRTKSLATSWRLRRTFATPRARRRQRFQAYSTQSWEEALRRLWGQGHNRMRRHSRDGWVRWSHTVSNNHNKRKGGRYACETYCNSQDDYGTD